MKRSVIIVFIIISSISMAQDNNRPLVEVTGEGIVNVVPDEVLINVSAENVGKDPRALKQQNDRIIDEVLKFLKAQGVPDKQMQTDYIRLGKNYDYNTKTYNYSANQSVTIKLNDLGKYETIMDGLMETGINRINNVAFLSSKSEELASEARKKAVNNAKMKAQEYAAVLGQTVGKAVSIRENSSSNQPSPIYRSAMAMDESVSVKQTLAPGEMQIKVDIYISFELN